MANQLDVFLNVDEFQNFLTLNKSRSSLILTSKKKTSPFKEYIFKTFKYDCYSPKHQKIILDTFNQISRKDCQYLLSYKYISFVFPSESSNFQSNPVLFKYTPVLIMKHISSSVTLEKVLKTPDLLKKWKIHNYLNCIFAVAEAMHYLHTNLICHGNLCPSNIIIDKAGQFYLCDFGLFPIKQLFVKEEFLFNEIYHDPLMQNKDPIYKNDVYSFGILMCELFFAFEQLSNPSKKGNLLDFIQNSDQKKFASFPQLFSELVPSCLNPNLNKRPTFKQILEQFKTTNSKVLNIKIQDFFDIFKSTDYLEQLALKKDKFALYKLGKMYNCGIKYEKNIEKAKKYYKEAILQGHSEALNNLGLLIQENAGDNKEEMTKGLLFLEKSATDGNIHGMSNYGVALLYGEGVDKNIEKAKEYLKKAADLGNSYAQINYGYTLLIHHSSSLDISISIAYIRKAIYQKNPFASYVYGVLIEKGVFGEKDEKLAFEYFQEAALLGDENATIKLDKYIKKGFKVKKIESFKINKKKTIQQKVVRLSDEFQQDFLSLRSEDKPIQNMNNQDFNQNNQELKLNNQDDNRNKQEFDQNKQEFDQNKQEFDQNKQEFDQNKQEFDQNRQEFDHNKQELDPNKQEFDQNNQEHKPNNQDDNTNKQEFDQNMQKFDPDDNKQQTQDSIEINSPIEPAQNDSPIAKVSESSSLNNEINWTPKYRLSINEVESGNKKAILDCAKLATTFNSRVYYYELAIEKQVPEALQSFHSFLLKQRSLNKGHEKRCRKIAQLFEKYEYFADAAVTYKTINDKANYEACIKKSKEISKDTESSTSETESSSSSTTTSSNESDSDSSSSSSQQTENTIIEDISPAKKASDSKERKILDSNKKLGKNDEKSLTFPKKINKNFTIISLGHVVNDRPGFHNKNFIYPSGFKSSRYYWSCIDATKKVHYICEIIDDNEEVPLFRVTMEENPEISYDGRTPAKALKEIVNNIVELRKKIDPDTSITVYGAQFFGLTANATKSLIEQLPGAEELI